MLPHEVYTQDILWIHNLCYAFDAEIQIVYFHCFAMHTCTDSFMQVDLHLTVVEMLNINFVFQIYSFKKNSMSDKC